MSKHSDWDEKDKSGFSTMSSAIEFADNYNNWILQIFQPYIKKNILEIGTGQGNFRRYLPSAETYVSIDIDPQVVARATSRNPQGIYLVADIASDRDLSPLKAFNFDTILCTNVLEHIESDRSALNNMIDLLQPQGNLLLFVPAFSFLYSNMDSLAGHYRRYTKQELQSRFDSRSSRIEKLEYFNAIGGMGWWVNKLFAHRDLNSNSINAQISFFDRYIVPFSKGINPLTKSFFGQSLICVVTKN